MRKQQPAAVLVSLCTAFACAACAGDSTQRPAGQRAEEPDFSPPPVPEFMLRKPEKPLTLEEMQRQADEAAQRARAQSGKAAPPPKPPAQSAGEKAQPEKDRP